MIHNKITARALDEIPSLPRNKSDKAEKWIPLHNI